MAQYVLNVKDYWFIIRKRRVLVITITLLVGILSFIFAQLNKPVPIYQATAQLSLEKNSTVAGLMLEVVRWTSWNDIETNARIIKSFSLIEKVAKKIGYIDQEMSSNDILKDPDAINTISKIQSQVTAEQVSQSNIIEIKVRSKNANEAQLLANTIADAFIEENYHRNNRRVKEAKTFIERLQEKQALQLADAEEKLKAFRRANKVFSLDQTMGFITEDYLKAKNELENIEKEKKACVWMIEQLSSEENQTNKIFDIIYKIPDLNEFIERLNNLQFEMETLLLDYTMEHPEVKKVQKKMLSVKSEIIKHLKFKLVRLERQQETAREILKTKEQYAQSTLEYESKYEKLARDVSMTEEIVNFLKEKHQEALIRESEPITEVYIVKPALIPQKPMNPHDRLKPTFVGFIMGLILGMLAAFIMENLDSSINTIEEVEKYLATPALGNIPFITLERIEKYLIKHDIEIDDEKVFKNMIYLVTLYAPKFTISETYRTLRTSIQFAAEDRKTFVITSTLDGEGKTTVAINLAFALSQIGKKTLLIEADFRKPKIHHVFGITREPGLADALFENCDWRKAIRDVPDILMGHLNIQNFIMSPGLDNLHIMTCGLKCRQPVEILQSKQMDTLLEEFKKEFDYIIIDAPPIMPVNDAVVIGSKVEAAIIVYRVGRVNQMLLKRAKLQLDAVKAHVLGIIFNGLKPDSLKEMYSTGYYYYYDYEGKEE
ncbi:MAG: GumC family protein [bacterium]